MAADVDHRDVGKPHGEGEEDLGIAKVRRTDGDLGDERADEEAGGHAGKAEEERPEGDLVGGFERWEPGDGGGFLFEAALLDEVEHGGEKRDKKRGVGGQEESDVEEDPAGVEEGEGGVLLARMEGGDENEEEADGEDEDAERDGFVTAVDEEEGQSEDEAEEGLGLVGVDGQAMVGGVEHLGERDEVEEDGGDGGGDGDVTPAGTVVERDGQNREGGDAVEKNRDSEPEERHTVGSFALGCESSVYRVMKGWWSGRWAVFAQGLA